MTDLAIIQGTEPGAPLFDLGIEAGDLSADDSLRPAVIVSLFTNARAQPEDEAAGAGWWGEKLDPGSGSGTGGGRRWGSRLWLLARAKVTPETLRRAEDYAREALAWMLDDGVASAVTVTASELPPRIPARGAVLRLDVTIERPSGAPVNLLFDQLWEAL